NAACSFSWDVMGEESNCEECSFGFAVELYVWEDSCGWAMDTLGNLAFAKGSVYWNSAVRDGGDYSYGAPYDFDGSTIVWGGGVYVPGYYEGSYYSYEGYVDVFTP
ncbi:MAG TPA: hypothetical protein DFR83_20265, partial [Deltaproteobacteria bacterium]|nr:hypothetical protein [Deltaproteobacteria bacterium]